MHSMTSAFEFAVDRTRGERLRTAWQGGGRVHRGRRECRHHASPAVMCLILDNADKNSSGALLPGRFTLGLVHGLFLQHHAFVLGWCMGYLQQRRQRLTWHEAPRCCTSMTDGERTIICITIP